MENWDASVVYQMASERHQEDIRRGEASQHLASLLGQKPPRARLAEALVALAARLDPVTTAAHQPIPAPV